jgi:hypothetical protein
MVIPLGPETDQVRAAALVSANWTVILCPATTYAWLKDQETWGLLGKKA